MPIWRPGRRRLVFLKPLARFLRKLADWIQEDPAKRAEHAGGPPPDWLARVRRGAPELLRSPEEGGVPVRFATVVRPVEPRLLPKRAPARKGQALAATTPPTDAGTIAPSRTDGLEEQAARATLGITARLAQPVRQCLRPLANRIIVVREPEVAATESTPATGRKTGGTARLDHPNSGRPAIQPALRTESKTGPPPFRTSPGAPSRQGPAARRSEPIPPPGEQFSSSGRPRAGKPFVSIQPAAPGIPESRKTLTDPSRRTLTDPPRIAGRAGAGPPVRIVKSEQPAVESLGPKPYAWPELFPDSTEALGVRQSPRHLEPFDVAPDPWPELPPEAPPLIAEWTDALRTQQRSRRLEREQRGGTLWSA